MKKVLVTGGLGYIGSHTVVELYNAGYTPVVVDDLSNSRLEVLDGLKNITGSKPAFHQVDVKDEALLNGIFNHHKLAAVIHFAAHKSVGESVEKPEKYFKNNVGGMECVLNACKEHGVRHFVFSSSCTVYGQPDELPVTESSPLKPAESPYGETKRICEELLEKTCTSNKSFKGISLRYFNPIGAHESAHIGELPLGVPDNLLPYLLQTAAGQREQLQVWGNNYNTPDGTAIRDYIHVVDLAKAHIKALQRQQQKNYEFYNVGTGKGYSVLEIIKTFEKVNKVKVNYKIADRRPGDIEKIWADTSLANRSLNWKAELNLEDMVTSAWKWQLKLQ